jgi:hypothetical protein
VFRSKRVRVGSIERVRWYVYEARGRLRRCFSRQLRRDLAAARDREREERIAERVLERIRPSLDAAKRSWASTTDARARWRHAPDLAESSLGGDPPAEGRARVLDRGDHAHPRP